jgi:transposase
MRCLMPDPEYEELLKLRQERNTNIAEIQRLTKLLQEALDGNAELKKQLTDLQGKLDIILVHIKKRNRRDYGEKTERHNPRPAASAVADEIKDKAKELLDTAADSGDSPRTKHILNLNKNLPAEPVPHKVDADHRLCPNCAVDTVFIGNEVTYQLDRISQSLKRLQHEQEVRACPKCKQYIVTADKPCPPIPKGLPGPGLLAHTIVSKYADFTPLYRLERIYRREGAVIPRSTLCDWILASSLTVTPLYDLLKARVLSSKVIQTDDTHVKIQDRKLKKKMRKGKMTPYLGDTKNPYIVFDFSADQSFERNKLFLQDFRGFVQADAANGFDALFDDGTKIEVGCNTHSRRRYFECLPIHTDTCLEILDIYNKLYAVEDKVRNMSPEDRLDQRKTVSAPLFAKLKKKLLKLQLTLTPKDPLMGAINYTLNHWVALTRFLKDPDLSICNNASERAVKQFVLARKNFLFAGSDAGGSAAAVHLSLVVSAKRNGIDPLAYMTDVLTRINSLKTSELEQLLPDNWAKIHAQTSKLPP